MREVPLTLPEIGMINSTRFIIGAGVGLLLAGAMDDSARKAVGVALVAVGTLVRFQWPYRSLASCEVVSP